MKLGIVTIRGVFTMKYNFFIILFSNIKFFGEISCAKVSEQVAMDPAPVTKKNDIQINSNLQSNLVSISRY